MAGPSQQALRLARALRDMRESTWPDVTLTQAQLAKVLSKESRVAQATLASWESTTSPKLPPTDKLRLYALFFCTPRSVEGDPRLLAERDLTDEERARFHSLETHLLELRGAVRLPGMPTESALASPYTWEFSQGTITIVCAEAPEKDRSPLADTANPNHTRMYRYADLDALIELFGHLRATNPQLQVFHRLPSEIRADDLSGHLVLLGGTGWNPVTRRLLKTLADVPVAQISVDDVETGEIFAVTHSDGTKEQFRPTWEDSETGEQLLAEDVGLLVRVRNPNNSSRTLTLCSGVHSRGVLGAVRCLTDAAVRESNEAYLASRFPGSSFAILMRVPVLGGETLTPDLENEDTRVYEWPPRGENAA